VAAPLICIEVIRSNRCISRGLSTTSYALATPAVDDTNYETETSDKSPCTVVKPPFNFLVKKLADCYFLDHCICYLDERVGHSRAPRALKTPATRDGS